MFSSVPFLVLLFSIILFIQSFIFYFFESSVKGIVPFVIMVLLSLIYFSIFLIVKIRIKGNRYSLFNFLILMVFFLSELYLYLFYEMKYLWVFLILTQVFSGYLLLNKRYFYITLSIHLLLYILFNEMMLVNRVQLEFHLSGLSALLLSFLIRHDRRQALINLADIYYSQKEINDRFQQLEDNISQIFILCSNDFEKYYYISSAFERMLTLPREKLLNSPDVWMSFIHPGDKERVNLELNSAAIDKSYREFDLRVSQDDDYIWLKFQLFPIKSGKYGLEDRFAVIVDNITENKLAELKLAEAQSLDSDFAARIQKNLLFSNPILNIQGLDIAAVSIPSLDVAGDFFDFYRFSDSIADIIIADVMGKGMIASMLGAASKSAFMKSRLDLTVLENSIPSIERIMTNTNRALSSELIKLGKFITMQYARINMENALFSFIDSGHTSILYYSDRHKCCWSLKGWNMPVGFNPQEKMINSIIPFNSGDIFFFYSDGVTEAENSDGEQFGERRLNYVLNSSAHLTSSQIMNKVKNLVFHYSSSEGFADDLTCIAMKIGSVNQKSNIVEGIFSGKRESLQVIRTFVSGFLNENFQNTHKEIISSIVLAVNEAVANIIEHNYEKDSLLYGREILIEAGKNGKTCFLRLFYDGKDFDWTTFQAPHLKEMKAGGYGLYLMREIMDSICYSANLDGAQCLTLIKDL
ncbi:MAG: SpoIIE family protein phosphatase [Spirochaetaceae bacterium]|nr:SpoIIE family protein phosphatase [Spirochaetaceae bacterium]